ncbi:hypothetical protein B0I35DRAFT_451284 [Stachybotrys elegans]|uniref:dolichol kinase n=1 Tax=Stachybotrys elegans TaxID=80388 RepID=A0A8K0SUQ5_9HYPO|nr:hypothetical protein B0I35DRAFT_451284 [Stachybotrys elegans]
MPSTESSNGLDPGEEDALRLLNRTPHPYHHPSFDLPSLHTRFALRDDEAATEARGAFQQFPHSSQPSPPSQASQPPHISFSSFSKESSHASDSGTEADDEHFLKGLPAPRVKLHKGLRGRNEPLSGTSTPLQSAFPYERDGVPPPGASASTQHDPAHQSVLDLLRRHRVLVRRLVEAGIVAVLGAMALRNSQVAQTMIHWSQDMRFLGMVYGTLLALYPIRILARSTVGKWSLSQLKLDSHFDPAPLIYPPAITVLVALLVSPNNPAVVLPNIVLSLCTLPNQAVPFTDANAPYNAAHWFLTSLPLVWTSTRPNALTPSNMPFVPEETLVLLYPLHITLCLVLHHLTTTSLLLAELQLLSVALINVLLLASSPQAQILKAVLWGGGLGLLISCGSVISWGIALARVPKWRFSRTRTYQAHHFRNLLAKIVSWHKITHGLLGPGFDDIYDTPPSSEGEDASAGLGVKGLQRVQTNHSSPIAGKDRFESVVRRHTLPYLAASPRKDPSYTPSGRRKRAISESARPFLRLTQEQAAFRKWIYAGYVYACVIIVIFGGIRLYIQKFALNGHEPLGWGLGYAFGHISWFRLQVIQANLENWICLPPRPEPTSDGVCHMGWVQHVRLHDFGEANTRLFLTGYWFTILIVGLMIVFQLKNFVEVDTRRKVFHFMMVGMFLPGTFVDPAYAAFALAVVLGLFLLLDLLRASQQPPLSKPIASFLAPYVDGRDFRGPVVISHIFLLIGCAIPLWLALASLPRTGSGYWAGWEVPTREVSMVSGVICVGLGDAAASLIGRRFGHRKWLWGGGKSLEGSVAFAAAVFAGLMAASAWVRLGRWPVVEQMSHTTSARNAAVCASIASLTEAVLTGGNDNVIVPVALWTCVKSLGV